MDMDLLAHYWVKAKQDLARAEAATPFPAQQSCTERDWTPAFPTGTPRFPSALGCSRSTGWEPFDKAR